MDIYQLIYRLCGDTFSDLGYWESQPISKILWLARIRSDLVRVDSSIDR